MRRATSRFTKRALVTGIAGLGLAGALGLAAAPANAAPTKPPSKSDIANSPTTDNIRLALDKLAEDNPSLAPAIELAKGALGAK
ncbi:hypothetical protein GOEFS_021_00330 [Gordonia effusa NBRC 100432]|uniref:Uncharacterized protein n=1 Tax=Gordonia effusa NBRC 100432 TaxID=1077974 RepID=H0QWK5_9ACTN|nr:hypothetical protein [Gordonia effusa]GAB17206.1 hypothetical protein GOEFS_021_00330 [Gordonia effusa NBRC 100432]